MSDEDSIRPLVSQILYSLDRIQRHFGVITSPDDFISSDEGLDHFDVVCIQLIALGENVKNLDKTTEGKLFANYPQVEWSQVKRTRDIISHHYFMVDTEIVFSICQDYLPGVRTAIEEMLATMQS